MIPATPEPDEPRQNPTPEATPAKVEEVVVLMEGLELEEEEEERDERFDEAMDELGELMERNKLRVTGVPNSQLDEWIETVDWKALTREGRLRT